jgi:hypothetical protein
MSALKTTPGRWRALKGARNYGIHSGDGTRLATVFASGDEPSTRNTADAMVMAAAPELLAALNELIEAADSMRATFGCIRGNTPEDSDTFIHEEWAEDFLKERADAARAAINKAAP